MRRRLLLGLSAALPALPRAAFADPAPAAGAPVGNAPPISATAPAVRRVHAVALLSTPALPADFTHWPWVNPNAPKGGEIALTALGSFDSFNPYILRGTPAVGISNLWDSLLKSSPDEASSSYGHLAGVIELPADRRSVSYELRSTARWHDGKPVTAEDVVWSFNTLRAQGRPFYQAYWSDVAEVVADSPLRVTFRFKTDQNHELPLILGEMPVLPKHWYAGRDFTQPDLVPPLGSGPYKVERFEAGRSVVFSRVEDYWARDLPTMKGTANWGRMRYEYFRDSTVALEAFKAGQIDFRTENVAKDWATAYDFPAVRKGLVKREEMRNHIPTGMQCFAMNLRRPLFQDIRVREALNLAFDFEWMNKNLFYGNYHRTESYFSNSELASSGLPAGQELAVLEPFRAQLPAALFTTPFTLPTTDGSGNNRANLRKGLELLMQAGWVVKDRQLQNAAGQPFQFEILLNGPVYERVALPYIQSLSRLGIQANVRTIDPAQYEVRMDGFDYDMTMTVFGESLSPGNEQRDYWGSAAAKQQGSQNILGLQNPVVDALINQLIASPDRDALVAHTRALDRVLLWGQYVVPNWHLQSFRIAYWDKFGRPPRNPQYGLGLDSWWIEPTRTDAVAAGQHDAQQSSQQSPNAQPTKE